MFVGFGKSMIAFWCSHHRFGYHLLIVRGLLISTSKYLTSLGPNWTFNDVRVRPTACIALNIVSKSVKWPSHVEQHNMQSTLTLLLLSWIVQLSDCRGCVCFCSFVIFFLVCHFSALSLAPLLYPRLSLTVCIQLNSTYVDCCCCCTCDHLRGLLLLSVPMTCSIPGSPHWLLLLLFINWSSIDY